MYIYIYVGATIAARQRVCLPAFLQLGSGPAPRLNMLGWG